MGKMATRPRRAGSPNTNIRIHASVRRCATEHRTTGRAETMKDTPATSNVVGPRIVVEVKPKYEVRVDLDERAFLFPAGKSISQVLFQSDGRRIVLEAIYPFNQTRTPPRLLSLELEDAAE